MTGNLKTLKIALPVLDETAEDMYHSEQRKTNLMLVMMAWGEDEGDEDDGRNSLSV